MNNNKKKIKKGAIAQLLKSIKMDQNLTGLHFEEFQGFSSNLMFPSKSAISTKSETIL